MKLAVVIVHYRTEKMTLDCLLSLVDELRAFPGRHAFIVDNASGDGSAERVAEAIHSRGLGDLFTFLSASSNGGFSAGNNLAIRAVLSGNPANGNSRFEAILLLNSDTLIHRGACDLMADALRQSDRVGIVGPRLEWSDGCPQASCFRYISPLSEMLNAAKTGLLTRAFRSSDLLLPNSPIDTEIEWISFACVLIRIEVFDRIGLLDDGYFMYFEDVDFCRRARDDGWKIAWQPAACVVHLRGGASAEDFEELERKRRPKFYYAARSRYLAKYYGRLGPCTANLLWTGGRSLSLARELCGRKTPHTSEHEALDIWTGCWKAPTPMKPFADISETAPTQRIEQQSAPR